MSLRLLETKSLKLVPRMPEEVRSFIKGMTEDQRAEVSSEWLRLVQKAKTPDPWTLGFAMVHRDTGLVIGTCGFKGPPGQEGMVEIAYGVTPEQQGKGYATEAARALVGFAFNTGKVREVRAHTLTEENASTRVLAKCGFRRVGEILDPDDGIVWRWELLEGAI
jgi:RimJ/RimL family protein N-acetyltransferase